MFNEETCATCPTPHPNGTYKCSGCNATFSTVGVSSSYRVVIGRAVYEFTRTWAYCPLCGIATRLKARVTKRKVMTLKG